ncbi:MAG: potassium transporter TrkG [Lachnospira eligens]
MFDNRIRKHLSSFRVITIGFGGLIILGALLLMLPVSSASGCVTPFGDALFTSTSAVCVTGLVVLDTGSYWSLFGQLVIITLIQIGGLGVITVAVAFSLLSGKKVSLMQRSFMQESVSAPVVGGIVEAYRIYIKRNIHYRIIRSIAYDAGILQGLWIERNLVCNISFNISIL